MSATQTELPLKLARLKRRAVGSKTVKDALELEDWQFDAVVDQGLIRGCVNIASKNTTRRELRFATQALNEYVSGIVVDRSAEELAELIFGTPQKLARVAWVYRCLGCDSFHLYNLARQRELRLAKGTRQRTGPGGSAVVEWSELVRFVRERRVS